MIEKLRSSSGEYQDSSKWDVLLEYDRNERQRVDRLKKDIVNGKVEASGIQKFGSEIQAQYEREKVNVPPSTIRKLGRAALDLLNITIPSSETRRDREAMTTALSEVQDERSEEQVQNTIEGVMNEAGRSVREIIYEQQKEQRDREQLERNLVETMESARQKEHNSFQNERAQELIERDLNTRLLTVDSLEGEALSGSSEVEKSFVEFEGEEIPVYNLKGIPFSMLSHAIDYRSASWDNLDHIGSQTSQNLLKNPALWTETRDQAERDEGYGTRGGNARGNVISTSYINSESNLDSRVGSRDHNHIHTCYGFSQLDGDSLLNIAWGDGGTANKIDDKAKSTLTPYQLNAITDFEGAETKQGYNEFLIRRYSETGKPKLPDYIISQDGYITEDMMRHAKFFSIPIVNIDGKSYQAKFEQRAVDALESISEDSSYEDISSAIDKIKTTARYNREIHTFDSIGDGRSVAYFANRRTIMEKNDDSEINKRLLGLEALELSKRPQFIAEEIKKAIEDCEKANIAGRKYKFSSDVLDSLDVGIYDVDTDAYSWGSFSRKGMNYNGPGACSYIDIKMVMKDSTRKIETRVCDGENRIETERYKVMCGEDSLENQDSSTYNTLLPIVETYIAALKTNNTQEVN